MSILIRDMEMPKNCRTCPMLFDGHSYRWCNITGESLGIEEADNGRNEYCPLTELPPHGRLVDADKLMMSLADWWYSSFGEEETDEAKAIRTVMDKIEQSIGEMTVVEAEGREE